MKTIRNKFNESLKRTVIKGVCTLGLPLAITLGSINCYAAYGKEIDTTDGKLENPTIEGEKLCYDASSRKYSSQQRAIKDLSGRARIEFYNFLKDFEKRGNVERSIKNLSVSNIKINETKNGGYVAKSRACIDLSRNFKKEKINKIKNYLRLK